MLQLSYSPLTPSILEGELSQIETFATSSFSFLFLFFSSLFPLTLLGDEEEVVFLAALG